jgi:hypothetical protein
MERRRKNSTLRAKLLWINYSLHIESASLCPLSLNTMFSSQALPLFLRFLSFLLHFLSYHCLTASVHSGYESFGLLLFPAVFLKHIRRFLLDSRVYTRAVLLQAAYICVVSLNSHVHQPLLLVCCVWWLLGRF